MKGLLIKDFKLMKGQTNFFLIITAIAIGMPIFSDDVSFMLGFLPFVFSLFTLSTISYDEFDNGNAFLFTLPISRAGYAIEKYCLALLLGGCAWIFATVLSVATCAIKGTASISEITMAALMLLPAVIIIQALMIPFQLKFGGEKGRLALMGVFGAIAVILILLEKAAEMIGIDIVNIINNLPVVNMGVMIAIMLIISVIILLLSIKISISIMNHKEF